MSPVTIWLCGWALGTFAIYKAAVRVWKNPVRHRQLVLLRSAANRPVGLVALALSAFMFWWLYVLVVPADMWLDSRWRPEQDGDDADA